MTLKRILCGPLCGQTDSDRVRENKATRKMGLKESVSEIYDFGSNLNCPKSGSGIFTLFSSGQFWPGFDFLEWTFRS